jgi:hypothetical protein
VKTELAGQVKRYNKEAAGIHDFPHLCAILSTRTGRLIFSGAVPKEQKMKCY